MKAKFAEISEFWRILTITLRSFVSDKKAGEISVHCSNVGEISQARWWIKTKFRGMMKFRASWMKFCIMKTKFCFDEAKFHITLKNGFVFCFSFFISLHVASPPVSTWRLRNQLCLKLEQGHWYACEGTWDLGTWDEGLGDLRGCVGRGHRDNLKKNEK